MKYIIRPVLPIIRQIQEINKAEYREITNAQKLAWDILLIKELFSYVIRNYSLLEEKIREIEVEASNYPDRFRDRCQNGSFARENSHTFNLLLINMLTTSRSYIEMFDYKGKNKKREIFKEHNDTRNILENLKDEYHDKNIICIFFWALRNYTQHHSSPVTGSPIQINDGIKIDLSVDAEKILLKLTSS